MTPVTCPRSHTLQGLSSLKTSLGIKEYGPYPLACLCGFDWVSWPVWASASPSVRWERSGLIDSEQLLSLDVQCSSITTCLDIENSLCLQALTSY